jgi:hypothetical protein
MLSPKSDQLINYGDAIIIYSSYLGRTQIYYLVLEDEKKIFDCYQGHFPHSHFVGMEYGTKVSRRYYYSSFLDHVYLRYLIYLFILFSRDFVVSSVRSHSQVTGKNGFVYVLFPTPELWTLALQVP